MVAVIFFDILMILKSKLIAKRKYFKLKFTLPNLENIPYKKEKNKTKFAKIALKFDFKTLFGYNSRLLMRSVSFACMLERLIISLCKSIISKGRKLATSYF